MNIYTSYPWLSPTFAFVSLEVKPLFGLTFSAESNYGLTRIVEECRARAFGDFLNVYRVRLQGFRNSYLADVIWCE